MQSYISATQLGITIASLALGWLGEPIIATQLEHIFNGFFSEATIDILAFTIAFSMITFMHIVLGELAPKTLALERTEAVALTISYPMWLFHQVFRLPIQILNWTGNVTVSLLGLKSSSQHVNAYTSEELLHLIDLSQKSGSIELATQEMLDSVFTFFDKGVQDILVPRNDVSMIASNSSINEIKDVFHRSGFSRLPVFTGSVDNIIGILHRRDFDDFFNQNDAKAWEITKYIHLPASIPQGLSLSKALKIMQESKTHLACIFDEFGGFVGIITMEDIIEEIVGEIADESDENTPAQITEDGDGVILDGLLTIKDFNHQFPLEIPKSTHYSTIAGFILFLSGRMLTQGETISYEGAKFTIIETDSLRIRKVRYSN